MLSESAQCIHRNTSPHNGTDVICALVDFGLCKSIVPESIPSNTIHSPSLSMTLSLSFLDKSRTGFANGQKWHLGLQKLRKQCFAIPKIQYFRYLVGLHRIFCACWNARSNSRTISRAFIYYRIYIYTNRCGCEFIYRTSPRRFNEYEIYSLHATLLTVGFYTLL